MSAAQTVTVEEHRPADAGRSAQRRGRDDPGARGVPDEDRMIEPQRVQEPEHLGGLVFQIVGCAAPGVARTVQVQGVHAVLAGE